MRVPRKLSIALACILPFWVSACASSSAVQTSDSVIRPKVVIVGYFETSRRYGEKGYWGEADRPGELHHWISRLKLERRLPVRGAFNQAWSNADGSIIAMKIGPNSLHPAVNITALGLDDRFDLTHSYWLINGIAGASPKNSTIGDIVWTDYVVNGDVAHEIDGREIPPDWPTGYFPAGSTRPYPNKSADDLVDAGIAAWDNASFRSNRSDTVFKLNEGLAEWALQQTAEIDLPNSEDMDRVRREYHQGPANASSRVKRCATLSAETFWLGRLLDEWAHDWVKYATDGAGEYCTTETNDAGTMTAIAALALHGRIDPDRVMLLRGASNFDMPPNGVSASEQLVREGPQQFAGYDPALEGLYRVGSVVVNKLVDGWPTYEHTLPNVAGK